MQKRKSNVWSVTKILGGYNEKTEKTSPEECMYFSTPMKIYRNEVALMAQANCQPKISALPDQYTFWCGTLQFYCTPRASNFVVRKFSESFFYGCIMAQSWAHHPQLYNTDVMRGFFELSKINNGILNVVLLLDPLKITPI